MSACTAEIWQEVVGHAPGAGALHLHDDLLLLSVAYASLLPRPGEGVCQATHLASFSLASASLTLSLSARSATTSVIREFT